MATGNFNDLHEYNVTVPNQERTLTVQFTKIEKLFRLRTVA